MSALSEIRRLREAKLNGVDQDDVSQSEAKRISRIDTYNAQEGSIYQELTEEEYNELVRKRREELPFVEDDEGGMGYYDDGEEQYFEDDGDYDEEILDADESNDNGKRPSSGALSSSYVKRAKKMQRAKLGTGSEQKITQMFFSKNNNTNEASKSVANKKTINPKRGMRDLYVKRFDKQSTQGFIVKQIKDNIWSLHFFTAIVPDDI
ncbi:unnamed protein product [Aphanomyces euteiches]